jgi:hypothetical protein
MGAMLTLHLPGRGPRGRATVLGLVGLAAVGAGCGSSTDADDDRTATFFVTSAGPGAGANLGGLAGADAHCDALARAAGLRERTWRAYLSTVAANGQPAVNARDRIGAGPWSNVRGTLIARTVAELHADAAGLSKATALTERGDTVTGVGDTPPLRHDILTGSQANGTAFPDTADRTCRNWTSTAAVGAGSAQVGHSDRLGTGGAAPTSWNSSHPSRGCGQAGLVTTGGAGLFYCFAR